MFCRALHFVAANKDMSDILKLLIARNADVDSLNVEMFSPLFFATQNSCIYNACILIMNGKSNLRFFIYANSQHTRFLRP